MRHALLLLLAGTGCSLFVRAPAGETDQTKKTDETIHSVQVAAIDSSKVAPGVESPYWNKVRAGGPLVVGINPSYPPFGVPVRPDRRAAVGEAYTGFDVELAEHLAATLGVGLVLRPVRSRDVMDALNSGRIDIALAGLTRTVYRGAQVNFSAPYLTLSQAAVVERRFVEPTQGTDQERRGRETIEDYFGLAKLHGIRIGVKKLTRPAQLAKNNFPNATIVEFDTLAEASAELVAGRLNAIVHDDAWVRAWFQRTPASITGRYRSLLKPVTREPIAMAIRKGDLEFLRFLDLYVQEVANDGTVKRLYRKHFIDAAWEADAELKGAQR